MLQAKDVKIRYNNSNGAWYVEYKGPSQTYTCWEFGEMEPGSKIIEVYKKAGQAVLGTAGLVIPSMNEIEIEVFDEI